MGHLVPHSLSGGGARTSGQRYCWILGRNYPRKIHPGSDCTENWFEDCIRLSDHRSCRVPIAGLGRSQHHHECCGREYRGLLSRANLPPRDGGLLSTLATKHSDEQCVPRDFYGKLRRSIGTLRHWADGSKADDGCTSPNRSFLVWRDVGRVAQFAKNPEADGVTGLSSTMLTHSGSSLGCQDNLGRAASNSHATSRLPILVISTPRARDI